MGLSRFWLDQASRAAARRRRRYDIEPPFAIRKAIEPGAPRPDFLSSVQLLLYVVFGTLRGFLALTWRSLTDGDTPRRRAAIRALADDLGGRLSESSSLASGSFERRLYSRDLARVPWIVQTLLFRTTPFGVVHAGHERDVIATLLFAAERRIPVYPRGVSSSAFGGTVPTKNGIVLDLSPLSEILEIDAAGLSARVQPGVRWADLAAALEPFGLTTASTPSSRFSTVAGWVSTGGLGVQSFKYGHVRDSVLTMRVVLPSGVVREVGPGDELFARLFGTEGQFGVITELVLRVRPLAAFSAAHLFYFDDAPAAVAFLDRASAAEYRPSHLVFYDGVRLAEENLLFRDRLGSKESVLEEREAVLVHFDDPEAEKRFLAATASSGSPDRSHDGAADFIWSERYFALKAQRLGPSLLAGEVLLPRRSLQNFVRRARRLGRRFGVELGQEAILAGDDRCTVIAAFRCDARRSLSYLLNLLLAQLLVRLGTRLGGSPYGFGTWNAPFLRKRYSRTELGDMRRLKKEVDPRGILNPGKFFRVRTRFWNAPGLIFRPRINAAGLAALAAVSPVVGPIARLFRPERHTTWAAPSAEAGRGEELLSEASLRCAFCGACVSVCPAYLLTRDELATGRAKLRLAETMASGSEWTGREASRTYQCLRCGLCEEVCQTRLPLVDCYTALESRLDKRFGRPAEAIARFVASVDENRDWIERTFGLSLADWSAGRRAARSPQTYESMNGGRP